MFRESEFVKLSIAVPVSHAQAIRDALGNAGAGVQGNYIHCSGSYRVVGRFTPTAGANPAIGSVGIPEEVEEEVIETLCHKDLVSTVIAAVRAVHPYEEPPIDILPRLEIVPKLNTPP